VNGMSPPSGGSPISKQVAPICPLDPRFFLSIGDEPQTSKTGLRYSLFHPHHQRPVNRILIFLYRRPTTGEITLSL
jgi:hypothetical protein